MENPWLFLGKWWKNYVFSRKMVEKLCFSWENDGTPMVLVWKMIYIHGGLNSTSKRLRDGTTRGMLSDPMKFDEKSQGPSG